MYKYRLLTVIIILIFSLFSVVTMVNAFPSNTSFDCSTTTDVPETECEALVALYNSTDGDNWAYKANWVMTTTVCSWHGVECNHDNSVRFLTLNYGNLTGTIPPEIGQLSNLERLILYYNHLSGEIPPEIGQLSNLDALWLFKNRLNGAIPPEIGQLSNLTELQLSENQLTGAIPPEIGQLSNLTLLNLRDNQLDGAIPPEIGQLSNLNSLHLTSNQLSGTIPAELGNANNLGSLRLSKNQLRGSIPPEIGDLVDLRTLDLSFNHLTGNIPPEIGNLTTLQWLGLHYNQLSGSIPPEIGNLSNLYDLFLNNNQLSGSIPAEIGNTNVGALWLYDNPFTGPLPSNISNLSLNVFIYAKTSLCVPNSLETWIDSVFFDYGTGIVCGDAPSGISGIVSNGNGDPLEDIHVSVYAGIYFVEHTTTDTAGMFAINGLGQDVPYHVYFADPSNTYSPEYYEDQTTIQLADAITLTVGMTREINATLDEFVHVPLLTQVTSESGYVSENPNDGTVIVSMPANDLGDISVTRSITCSGGITPTDVSLDVKQDWGLFSYEMVAGAGDEYHITLPTTYQLDDSTLTIDFMCDQVGSTIPVGNIVFYEPFGTITDATTNMPIAEAKVTLYNVPDWFPRVDQADNRPNSCQSNLSKPPFDPWSQPAPIDEGLVVNPDALPLTPDIVSQVTDSTGYYGWNVLNGCWYVTVEAAGYVDLVSPVVGLSTGVTDLDLQLTPFVVDMSAVQSAGNSLDLDWQPDFPTTCTYALYQGTTPYFTPAEGTLLDGNAMPIYNVPNVIGDFGTNYFFQVQATECVGAGDVDSLQVGEFDFAIVSGTP